jgi:sensor domain CHASE-containing protein
MIFQVIWAILALLLLLIQLSALILQIRWHKLEQRDLLKELEKYKNY